MIDVEEIKFDSYKDLYNRLLPALKTRESEINRKGYEYILAEDIWNFLKDVKWVNSKNLTLFDLTHDILNTDPLDIDAYIKKNLRRVNIEETKEEIL